VNQSILKLYQPLNFHEWIRLANELDAAMVEMWKAWAISKIDRDDEIARERYLIALRRVAEIRLEMEERGMP
jgi:hypothetical protein